MTDVLDPRLLDMVERMVPGSGAEAQPVEVLVGLTQPLDDALRAQVQACGLNLRSEVGDVLTGVINLGAVGALSALDCVLRIEASSPVHRENAGKKPPLPTE